MTTRSHDLVVVGAGPGGYVAAIRAAQLGLNVGCVEKEAALGGTCLRIGCIPSKALLQSSELYIEAREKLLPHGIRIPQVELDLAAMLRRKEQIVGGLTKGVESLLKKNKITRYHGTARLEAPGQVSVASQGEATVLKARYILIATGSKPATLPGIQPDGERIVTSTEALSFADVPQHLIVVGAGYIGLELGSVWRRLGARVTIVEFLDRILPGMDAEIATEAQKLFEKQGLEFHLDAKVAAARVVGKESVIEIEGAPPLRGDRVLLAVGRKPNTDGLGLESVRIVPDERGRIPVNEHFETPVPGIYAIGDVIGGPMLAHKAEEEGMACVEHLVTSYGHVDYNSIPAIVYTYPEIASVGKTEEELEKSGVPVRKGVFPFRANGRAQTLGQTEGKIKILAHQTTDRVLGVHILGPRAGDLIAEAAAAMAFGASSEDLARCSHAHPTLAEALKEAALAVDGRAIHI